MQIPKNVKKIWDAVSTVLVVLVVVFAVFLMGSRLVGLQVFHVISPSMEPTYSVGDLLYVKSVDPDSVKVGDPITFVMNEDLVVATHRVVAVDGHNRQFTTKGDANKNEDAAPVHFNNLIGIPKFHVPMLGYVSDYVQHPPGTYFAIAFCVVLLAAVFLPDLIFGGDEEETPPAAVQVQKTLSVDNQSDTAEEKETPKENQEGSQ
jgi:signal peptidase